MNEKAIKVAELKSGETGRGIARLDPELMDILGLKVGDIIQIDGTKKTVAKVLRGGPEDANRGTIRIDGSTRRNAGVSLDERVAIKKVVAKNAEKITFAPTEQLRLQGGEEYLKQVLEGRALAKGDTITLNVMGNKIDLVVTSFAPSGDAVLMDSFCQKMADELGAFAVNVNYTKADMQPLPYAQEEVADVIRYFAAHAGEYGIDPERIVVGGHSAGAHLACCAGVLLAQEDFRLAGEMLVYPVADLTREEEMIAGLRTMLPCTVPWDSPDCLAMRCWLSWRFSFSAGRTNFWMAEGTIFCVWQTWAWRLRQRNIRERSMGSWRRTRRNTRTVIRGKTRSRQYMQETVKNIWCVSFGHFLKNKDAGERRAGYVSVSESKAGMAGRPERDI